LIRTGLLLKFLITTNGVSMKRFSLPIFSASAPSAMTLAIGLGLSAMSLAVQAHEKVLRTSGTCDVSFSYHAVMIITQQTTND
jgi:hypothetical protein